MPINIQVGLLLIQRCQGAITRMKRKHKRSQILGLSNPAPFRRAIVRQLRNGEGKSSFLLLHIREGTRPLFQLFVFRPGMGVIGCTACQRPQ